MTVCVIVLQERIAANQLNESLKEAAAPITKFQLIQPSSKKQPLITKTKPELPKELKTNTNPLTPVEIDTIKLLNPKISRSSRQRRMAFLLMPFGFMAGLTFTQMTELDTFSHIGLGPLGQPIIGSLLGMGSGLIGSYVAAASVSPDKDDYLWKLRKISEEGKWLLLLETPFEVELPWQLIKEIDPVEIVTLRDL